MKLNTIAKLALLPLVFTISACAIHATDYRMTYDNTTANFSHLKQGQSCMSKGRFTGWNGDATISAAAKAGNIKKVHYVKEVFDGNADTICTVVYGK